MALLMEFQYYFAQREAVETIIYLYDVVGVKDKYDLIRFDFPVRCRPACLMKIGCGWW